MVVTITQNTVAEGEVLLASVASAGVALVESDFNPVSLEIDLDTTTDVPLGPVNSPGGFIVHIAVADEHYVGIFTILPIDGGFSVGHQDIQLTQPVPPPEPFSPDILTKFLNAVTVERLKAALDAATAAFPAEHAAAIRNTAAICALSFALLEPVFCFTTAAELAIDFVAKTNDLLLEGMVTDGALEDGEANFLKLLWGTASLALDVTKIVEDPADLKNFLDVFEHATTVFDLVTDDGPVQFGVHSSGGTAQKSFTYYEINPPP